MIKMDLRHGDCLEVMKDIPDKSIDLVLVDPPYGTTSISWDVILPMEKLWDSWKRIVKQTGTIIVFGNQPFTSLVVTSNVKWFKQCLVWDKNKCGSPGLANIRPMQIHEDIIIFAEKRTTYNPQMETGTPFSRNIVRNEMKNTHGYGLKDINSVNTGTRFPKSILRVSRDFSAQQQEHPTQKPVPLLEYLIKTYSNEGDIVLDNCMGSGSTGVACKMTNRNFIGIEQEQKYFDIAEKRINNIAILPI
jgi:site-specific DNA-methyltransferase (adenine-specific)